MLKTAVPNFMVFSYGQSVPRKPSTFREGLTESSGASLHGEVARLLTMRLAEDWNLDTRSGSPRLVSAGVSLSGSKQLVPHCCAGCFIGYCAPTTLQESAAFSFRSFLSSAGGAYCLRFPRDYAVTTEAFCTPSLLI